MILTSRRLFLTAHLLPGAASLLSTAWLEDDFGAGLVHCEGEYPDHLQGVCRDSAGHLFWSFTTTLVKTDRTGRVLREVHVPPHHGAPCMGDRGLYVPVNRTVFNDAAKPADSWIYVYDSTTLQLLSRHRAAEVVFGAGGMAFHKDGFVVVGGLPEGYPQNRVYQYDRQLRFKSEVRLAGGTTHKGIQTAIFADGLWWFGCYGSSGEPGVLLRANKDLTDVQRFRFDCSLGIVKAGDHYLVGRPGKDCTATGCTGTLLPAVQRAATGLELSGPATG